MWSLLKLKFVVRLIALIEVLILILLIIVADIIIDKTIMIKD